MFEVGDKVKCKTNVGVEDDLTIDEVYEVIHHHEYAGDTFLYLRTEDGNEFGGWLAKRFEKVEEPTP